MAHELDMTSGKGMVYVGDVPWHGLGQKIPADLTPEQVLTAAGLDWTVEKVPLFAGWNNKKLDTGTSALVRDNGTVLDTVSNDWNIVQNHQAFEFFNDFVGAGDMEMHTAGSLKNGQIVWALAKIKESFDVVKNDQVDSYMLFTNPHKYGWSTSVSLTPIRVVCMNTLRLSLGATNQDKIVRVNHSNVFDADEAKMLIGVSHDKLMKYKETAKFLASKKAKHEDVVAYFKRIFPLTTTSNKRGAELSRNAEHAIELLEKQPGAKYGAGTWWQPVNSVTYFLDHVAGRSADNRLTSAWYGTARKTKIDAIKIATEMANAA